MKKHNYHLYTASYSEIRKSIERLLFEPKNDDRSFINGFSQLEQSVKESHPDLADDLRHELVCEIYNDLFHERLIVIDPVRGFHIFTVSPKCVRRYKKRHLRPGQSLNGR